MHAIAARLLSARGLLQGASVGQAAQPRDGRRGAAAPAAVPVSRGRGFLGILLRALSAFCV